MRLLALIVALLAVGLSAGSAASPAPSTPKDVTVKKATPLMTVEDVDACLPFWTERMGFTLTATVPHEDKTGFAMLNNGPVELMYQSRASIDADLGASGAPAGLGAELAQSTMAMFMEVEGPLDDLVAALDGIEIVVPRRQTFYGMDEIFVRAPCGTLVGIAAKIPDAG